MAGTSPAMTMARRRRWKGTSHMPRIAFVNGRYVPHRAAAVHIEDRGYQFADGVYEVVAVRAGAPVNLPLHFARLARSLGELRIAAPVGERVLERLVAEMVRRNRLADGIVYLQVTRGVAPRDHAFPAPRRPSLVMTARRAMPPSDEQVAKGVKVITIPDIRWRRCDIKSISLLPNVLGKQQAREAGAFEAWQVDGEGMVTEGTSTNAWIVTQGGELVTRQADHTILPGVTRRILLGLANEAGLRFVERPFSLDEARAGREAFLTSTTSLVLPITRIDETTIGGGRPGPVAGKLRQLFLGRAPAGPA
jgi:D-alanine transaminase